MARAVLTDAGLRVGTMPKPHLVSYRERIAIDGVPLSPERFAAAIARVLPAVDRVAVDIGPPTEFEALTAAAYAELAGAGLDLAIVEVGMGGRLDATNSADLGVAAITNVQHDHEAHLGGRPWHASAREKAAIVKPRRPGGDRRVRARAAPRSTERCAVARSRAAAGRPATAVPRDAA